MFANRKQLSNAEKKDKLSLFNFHLKALYLRVNQ